MDSILKILQNVSVFNESNQYIDLVVIFLVVCGGLFAKNYLTFINWAMALKTLFVGTLLAGIYICIKFADIANIPYFWQKMLISYTVATSFYEIILKYIIEWIQSKIGTNRGK